MVSECPDNYRGSSDCPNMVLASDSLFGKIWFPWFTALFAQLLLFPPFFFLQQAWEQLHSTTPAICAPASQILTLWFNNPPHPPTPPHLQAFISFPFSDSRYFYSLDDEQCSPENLSFPSPAGLAFSSQLMSLLSLYIQGGNEYWIIT